MSVWYREWNLAGVLCTSDTIKLPTSLDWSFTLLWDKQNLGLKCRCTCLQGHELVPSNHNTLLNNPHMLRLNTTSRWLFSQSTSISKRSGNLDIPTTEAKVTPATEEKQVAPGPSIPGEVIEKTQDILQGIVSSSLVATALSGSGKVVGEETGHLTGQPWVHSLCGATFRGRKKERKSSEHWSRAYQPVGIVSVSSWSPCMVESSLPISLH